MPPPKKPKNGPTSVEQFLSKEELQVLGKDKRPVRKEGNGDTQASRGSRESLSFHATTQGETSPVPVPAGVPASPSSCDYEMTSVGSAGQRSSTEQQDSVHGETESEQDSRDVHHDISPSAEPPDEPPKLILAKSLSSSTPSADEGQLPGPGLNQHGLHRSGGESILERLFTARPTEIVNSDNNGSYTDHPSWPHGLGPPSMGQPSVFPPNVRHPGLGYRLTTSNTLASLVTRPAWMPFDHPRALGTPGQSNMHLNLRPSSSLDIQGLQPAASFSSVQHHQQQQQQQQHLDGRSILTSLFSSQMSSGSSDMTSPHSDEVFMLKTSQSSRAGSCASSYLSSLMRQPLSLRLSGACGGVASRVGNPTHRTESAPVYLHPAFQLPPSTTSGIRKNNSTSSLSLLPSPPPGNSCLLGLPRHSNAKTFPHPTSPLKPTQGQTQAPFLGSSSNIKSSNSGSNTNNSNTNTNGNNNGNNNINNNESGNCSTSSINNSPVVSGIGPHNNNDNKEDVHLLDLSLKNKHNEETNSSRDKTQTSPPRKSSVLTALMDDSRSEVDHRHQPMDTSSAAGESDDSNSFINVTSPVPPSSLLRAISEPKSSPSTVMENVGPSSSSELTGLLTMNPRSTVPTSSPLAVKEEIGASNVPYALVTCKTERYPHGSDADSREPSDCKSPKEEGRMVSPSSCMQVLPLGGSGESSGGSAHLQAATSTTPEAGSGPLPHNFLLDVHGAGVAASPPSHMKQELGGAVPGSSIQAKLCQVCNDNASGFHYGVWSCEGCKAFFKRSIQGPVDYICPATNTCTIDKHRRKSCQACRLRRCYEVGMNKGSQRKERKSSTTTTGLKGKRCRADSSDSAINSTNNGASSSKAAKRSRSASILEALQKADLPVLESYHNHNLPATRVHLLNTLIKLADRELVYLINWAKHVPGYTCLTLSDQVHLIECCWMELLLLNCAFRSMEYEGRTLVFAPDFHLERQQWGLTGMGDVLEQVSAVSEQMVLYGLNKEELLLLQATVLVNAEVRRLDSFVKIQEMRQIILDVFMEVAGRHQGYGSWRHAPSILLLLTHIRQAGERGITYFQRLKMEGCVTFCDLLTEMLDAHNSSGERRRLQQQQQQQQHHQPQQHPSQAPHQQQHPSQHQPTHHQHPQQQQQHPQHSMAPE